MGAKKNGYYLELNEAAEEASKAVDKAASKVKEVAETATSKAKEVAETATSKAKEVTETATSKVKEVAETATSNTQKVAEEVAETAKSKTKKAASKTKKAAAKVTADTNGKKDAASGVQPRPDEVVLVQSASGVRAEPSKEDKSSAKLLQQPPTETTFAPKYLVPTNSNGRRRPGANMNSYLDMARQIKTPG